MRKSIFQFFRLFDGHSSIEEREKRLTENMLIFQRVINTLIKTIKMVLRYDFL